MKMATFFFQENKLGIMGNHHDDDDEHGDSYDLGNNSSSDSDSDLLNGSDSNSDSDSDLFEEVNSSSSSFGSSATPSRSKDALHDMSSLLEELPIKRGLSKHYNGKSQSFTSLSNVRSLEDLAKPEHPYNKKLKTCKSYQQFEENNNNNNESDHHHLHLLQLAAGRRRRRSSCSSKIIKKASLGRGGSFSSLCTKRNGSFDRPPLIPPLPPHKSDNSRNSSFNTRSPLFALGV